MVNPTPESDSYHGTVAITGGMGMLGSLFGRWLVQRKVAHVLLLGRSAGSLPAALSSASCSAICLAKCDAASSADVKDVLTVLSFGAPPVAGLLHAGGALADATLPNQTSSSMRRAFAPKVGGALNCWAALHGSAVGPLVLFSSIASLMGSPGQASYAAANAVLDGMAAAWHAAGSSAVSVQWGAWAGGGMAVQDAGTLRRLERSGMGTISAMEGMAALEGLLKAQGGAALGGLSQVAVAPINWRPFLQRSGGRVGFLVPAIAEVQSGQDKQVHHGFESNDGPLDGSMDIKEDFTLPSVEQVVLHAAMSVIDELDVTEDTLSQPILAAGLDSLGAVEMRSVLERELGLSISATALFDFPTIRELSSHLYSSLSHHQDLGGEAADRLSVTELPQAVPAMHTSGKGPEANLGPPLSPSSPAQDCVVGILGSGNRFPENVASSSLVDFQDCSSTVPLGRWDVERSTQQHTGSTAVRHGVFCKVDLAEFDAGIFSVSDNEAIFMDPQQRLLLECVSEASYSFRDGHDTKAGVFVGIWAADYLGLSEHLASTPFQATGSSMSVAAGRVSYTYGLEGPSLSIETACSSSLVATHLAHASITSMECGSAFAAGLSLILSPAKYIPLDAAGMLSPSGRCKPLDVAADGYARGEAAICMLLKGCRPSDPETPFMAIIQGSAMNQDGRSSSLTSPYGPSQQTVLEASLACSGSSPSCLGAIQLHGTGTSLGDPIELGALVNVLSKIEAGGAPVNGTSAAVVHLQACKSMFAHSEAAAGIVGLSCAVSMHCGSLSAGIQHLRDMNPYAKETVHQIVERDLQAGRQTASWSSESAIATSSFAYQGTNCNVISNRSASGTFPQLKRSNIWLKERFWPLPTCAFSLHMSAVIPSGTNNGMLQLQGPLDGPILADALQTRIHNQAVMHNSFVAGAIASVPEILQGLEHQTVSLSQLVLPGYTEALSAQRNGAHPSLLEISIGLHAGSVSACFPSFTPHVRSGDAARASIRLSRPHVEVIGVSDHLCQSWPQPGVSGLIASPRPKKPHSLAAAVTSQAADSAMHSSLVDFASGICAEGLLSIAAGTTPVWIVSADGLWMEKSQMQKLQRSISVDPGTSSVSGMGVSVSGIRYSEIPAKGTQILPAPGGMVEMEAVYEEWLAETPASCHGSTLGLAGGMAAVNCVDTSSGCSSAVLSFLQLSVPVSVAFNYERNSGAGGEGQILGLLRVANSEKVHSRLSVAIPQRCAPEDSVIINQQDDLDTSTLRQAVACSRRHLKLSLPGKVGGLGLGGWHGAAVLITGGTGQLGCLCAHWMRSRGASEVLLLGRNAAAKHMDLTGFAKLVTVIKCDVAAWADMMEVHSSCSAPIAGTLHAGGLLTDGTVGRQTIDMMRAGVAPKLDGAKNLFRLLGGAPTLEHAMFSSIAALVGSPGQASYAAANGALNSLASVHRQSGCGAVTVEWGPWAGGGMAMQNPDTVSRLARNGFGMIDPREGLAMLSSLMTLNSVHHLAVSNMDWRSLLGVPKEGPPGVERITEVHDKEGSIQHTDAAESEPILQPTNLARLENLDSMVSQIVGKILGSSEIVPEMPLVVMGMDSLSSLELRSALEDNFSLSLPATILYDCPTINDLTEDLKHRLATTAEGMTTAARPPRNDLQIGGSRSIQGGSDQNTAILSMAWELPGANVDTGVPQSWDCSCRVPMGRWDVESAATPGLGSLYHASFLRSDIAEFDAQCFSIMPAEASVMDPQHRLLLKHVGQLDSFWDSSRSKSRVGVFCGIYPAEYTDVLLQNGKERNTHFATSSSISVAAGRISYTFGYNGPCIGIDTACSSASVALHVAMGSLATSESSAAIGCTASLILSPQKCTALVQAGMLSAAGRCRPLDASADGYARGEAVVAMILQAAAETYTASQPMALLRGSAVNQDGRSSSLTAPHGPSQQVAIRLCCQAALQDLSAVDAVQLHGTGTPLGDPIEVGGLSNLLLDGGSPVHRQEPIVLQASKSMFSHSEPSAGMVSMLCALGITGSGGGAIGIQHLRSVNPLVQESMAPLSRDESCFSLPRQSSGTAWLRSGMVATSSFAYQGTNCCLLTSDGGQPVLPSNRRGTWWNQARHWAAAASPHDILTSVAIVSHVASRDLVRLQGGLATARAAYFWQHVVQGAAVLPGSCYMDLSAAAPVMLGCSSSSQGEGTDCVLANSLIPQPLLLGTTHAPEAPCLEVDVDVLTGFMRILSRSEGSPGMSREHYSATAGATPSRVCQGAVRRLPEQQHFRHLVRVLNNRSTPCVIASPLRAETGSGSLQIEHGTSVVFNPAALDCCMQLGQQVDISVAESGATYVPAALDLCVLQPPGRDVESLHSSVVPMSATTSSCITLDHNIRSCTGSLVGGLNGFMAKAINVRAGADSSHGVSKAKEGRNLSFLQVEWEATAPSSAHSHGKRSNLATEIAVRSSIDDMSVGAYLGAVVQAVTTSAVQGACLHLRNMSLMGWKSGTPDEQTQYGSKPWQQSALWGLMQTASREADGSTSIGGRVSLQHPSTQETAASASFAILPPDQSTPDMQVDSAGASHQGMLLQGRQRTSSDLAYQLVPSPRGTFGGLAKQEVNTSGLKPGEVCVQVKAVGINFRDVLNILGMYPGDPGLPGTDVSGVVVDTGPGVSSLQCGQAVFGLAPGCFGSHVVSREETLASLPQGVSLSQAATMPTVFVTVDMALEAAGARAGQTILIHGGAGGVGLAATQAAGSRGLSVVATAGSAAKRSVLRELGVHRVFDSRSTKFVESCAMLCSKGVDMALNSLTSSGMLAGTVSVLSVGGCIVELSKRDIWSHSRLCSERQDIRFHMLALDFLPSHLLQQSLRRLALDLAKGRLGALPSVTHSMSSIQAALRQMSQVWPLDILIPALMHPCDYASTPLPCPC